MTSMSSILIIHGGALGDFVLSLSVVQALRAAGAERIAVLARGAHAALARRGGVDEYWDIDIAPWHLLFVQKAEYPSAVREQLAFFDLTIDTLGVPQLRNGGASRIICIDPRLRTDHR